MKIKVKKYIRLIYRSLGQGFSFRSLVQIWQNEIEIERDRERGGGERERGRERMRERGRERWL